MITINRSAATPVHEQLVEQLRYLIASGQYQVDEQLPSTRMLADQVGVSFHTVRKAYQQLEREGRLEARIGSGYRVKETSPLSKSARMEQGASIVQEALQKLIGLGLQDQELAYLFEEQVDLMMGTRAGRKLLFVAPYREMAELCAAQLSHSLQQPVEPCTMAALPRHLDADYAFTRFADLRAVIDALPRTDVHGVLLHLSPDALERVARLLPNETFGLLTRYEDAIQPLLQDIRDQTGFAGQALAASMDQGTEPLQQFIAQTDLLLYTPPCRRRLLALLDGDPPHVSIAPTLSKASIDRLRQHVPA